MRIDFLPNPTIVDYPALAYQATYFREFVRFQDVSNAKTGNLIARCHTLPASIPADIGAAIVGFSSLPYDGQVALGFWANPATTPILASGTILYGNPSPEPDGLFTGAAATLGVAGLRLGLLVTGLAGGAVAGSIQVSGTLITLPT